MVPLGKLKMCVMVMWILLVFLPQEIILPIIFYWVCVPVRSSCTSLVWMCSLARWFIGETSCLCIRHFLRTGFGAGWGSVGTKKLHNQNRYQFLWQWLATALRMEEPRANLAPYGWFVFPRKSDIWVLQNWSSFLRDWTIWEGRS